MSMTYRYKNPPTYKQLKVSRLIWEQIAILLSRKEISSPEIDSIHITVSGVKISPDLRMTTVFVLGMNMNNVNCDIDFVRILNKNSPKYRKKISNKIKLRFIPEIRFVLDNNLDKKMNIEKLIDEISAHQLES